MSLNISKVFTYDTDAGNYIQAVEAADEAASPGIGALEPATRQAINNFVVGCKQDGIWDAIKASCILAGARTLSGALIPLVGTAPTNNGPFVAGDYNRKTGLVGDGSTKYLNSNRAGNIETNVNRHIAVYAASAATTSSTNFGVYIGNPVANGAFHFGRLSNNGNLFIRACNNNYVTAAAALGGSIGFLGLMRTDTVNFSLRASANTFIQAQAAQTPSSADYLIFSSDGSSTFNSNARLAFYSIGESLDLAKLDARVTDLITAFGAAIP